MPPIHRRKGAEEGARNGTNFGADAGNAEAEETNLGHARPSPQHQQARRICFVAMIVVYAAICLVFRGPFRSLSSKQQQVEWEDWSRDYQKRYKRLPPPTLKQWLEFAVSNDCETMEYYNSIERDLKVFRKRPKEIFQYSKIAEPLTKYTGRNVVIRIKDNTLTFVKWKIPFKMTWEKREEHFYLKLNLRWLFAPLTHHKPPIDTTFVYNLMDEPTDVPNSTFPVFGSCHASRENDHLVYDNRTAAATTTTTADDDSVTRDLLLPYYFSIGPFARGLWFWPFHTSGPPWNQRKDVITWRGSTTGIWEKSPRFWLTSRDYQMKGGVIADFGFVRVVQNYQGQDLPSKYRRAERMSYSDMQKHKYVLDVDGNSFTERFPKLLRTGSLIFKSTTHTEWFSERLQPFVDYVPVNYDQSDLVEKVEWAHAHQSLAQSIAKHGKETSERHIRPQDQQCYTYRLILEYHSLFEQA